MNYPQENIKPYNSDEKKGRQVEKMFDNIASAYDKLNHTLSFGIDKIWRRKAIKFLRPFAPQKMMDVATGTGDFAIQAYKILKPMKDSKGYLRIRNTINRERITFKIHSIGFLLKITFGLDHEFQSFLPNLKKQFERSILGNGQFQIK